MATTEVFYNGDGSDVTFTIPFEYLEESDVKVSVGGTLQTQDTDYTFSTLTEITFTTAPPTGTDNVRIFRDTDINTLRNEFFAGSAIRAQDLNDDFLQTLYTVQEISNYTWDNETDTVHSDETWVSSDTQIATTAAMDQRFQDEATETIESSETWVSDNDHIATTAAIDARFQDELSETITSSETWPNNDDTIATTAAIDDQIDLAITNDIGTDGTGITVTDDGDGTITLGLAAGTIDLDRLKASDVITLAEQNASPTTDDDSIFTSSAAAKRFDTIVQTTTPTGTDYEVGKTWLQNDEDKTVSIWNGNAWVAVASGGAFTELGKVVYVDAINGDDSLAGHRISNPKRTIKAAMDQINAETDAVGNGSLVIVAPGIYDEEFPITIEKNDVSVVGTSLRNCVIHPAIGVTAATAAVASSEYRIRFVGTTDFTAIGAADNNVGTVFTATGAGTGTGTLEDTAVQAAYDVDVPEANELSTMFQVNSGTYIQNLTLQGMKASGTRGGNTLDTDATFGLPTNQGWNFAFFPGATIRKSPYIQNCTNFSDSQINNVTFTPHVPGEGAAGDLDSGFSGGGILIDGDIVDSNSPLRSMVCDSYTHTALNGPGIFVTNNGYTQVTSSYAFFTHYHLKCLNGGQANLAASTSDFGRYSLIADGQSSTNIFTSNVDGAAADGDATFNINQPTADASWHGNANRPQPNMLVTVNGVTYPILSATARTDSEGGDGWTVTISRPDPANRSNNLGLNGAISDDAAVQFFLRSQIASSGHTMEYVGSGTDYRALPENSTGTFPVGSNDPITADASAGNAPCGVPVDERQTIVLNNGAIWTAITDHNGKFRIGGDQVTDPTYEVDQQLGRVTFRTGSLSIPTLIENLDTNGFNIFDGTGHVNINDELDVNNNKIVNLAAPTANTDAATKLYVDSQVSVADKIQDGTAIVECVDDGTSDHITFDTEGSERMKIDSGGRIITGGVNNFSTIASYGDAGLQLNSTNSTALTCVNLINRENNDLTHGLVFARARDGGANSGRVVNGQSLGAVSFQGFGGSGGLTYRQAAEIRGIVDAAPDNDTMPGRLEFFTADTASPSVLTERMRIDSNGDVNIDSGTFYLKASSNRIGLGTTSPNSTLDIQGSSPEIRLTATSVNRSSISHSAGGLDLGQTGNLPIRFFTNASERLRIDGSGRVLVNTTDTLINQTGVQTLGKSEAGLLAIGRNDGTLLNDYSLGEIKFLTQAGGGGYQQVAEIQVLADGTHTSSSKASRMVFRTAEDGEASTRERWRISNEGILTNQEGNHAHGSQDFINNYRCQFGVFSSAESGTNGSSAVGSGPFDSTYLQSEWGNATLTYGMVNELKAEYNLSQLSRANIGSYFKADQPAANDNSFPTGGSNTNYWNPRGAAIWAVAEGIGGYNGCASVRADIAPVYGSGTAYYARVKFAATSGVGHGYHCDLGGHPFGGTNVGYFVRQIDNQNQAGCSGFVYRRGSTSSTMNAMLVQNTAGGTIGSIRCTNTGTSFNTSSDYRLKENVTAVTNGIELVKQMPVKSFNFIGDTETITGFLAHEIQDAAPYAVNGVKDGTKEVPATDENGQPVLSDTEVDGIKQPVMETVPEYQSVDYGKLTPILTAALQEAIAKIETLEARIVALETP